MSEDAWGGLVVIVVAMSIIAGFAYVADDSDYESCLKASHKTDEFATVEQLAECAKVRGKE